MSHGIFGEGLKTCDALTFSLNVCTVRIEGSDVTVKILELRLTTSLLLKFLCLLLQLFIYCTEYTPWVTLKLRISVVK